MNGIESKNLSNKLYKYSFVFPFGLKPFGINGYVLGGFVADRAIDRLLASFHFIQSQRARFRQAARSQPVTIVW